MPNRSVTPRRLFYSLGRQIQSRPNKGEPEFRCSARLVREGSVGVNRRIVVTPDFFSTSLLLFYYCNYNYRIIITIVIIITVLLD
jgi:hypothetical protein